MKPLIELAFLVLFEPLPRGFQDCLAIYVATTTSSSIEVGYGKDVDQISHNAF